MDQAKVLARTIQSTSPEVDEGAICVGWVMVSEWVAADGSRFLASLSGDADGEQLPFWQVDSYLSNAPTGDEE